ncbi:MAG: lipoyl(octanoyl) transferase LipB [Anaerolineae bacterium]
MDTLEILDLGLIEYQRAWDLQETFAAEIAAGQRPPTLLLLEHPHTFTFGRRGHVENLLWSEAELEQRGVKVYWVDRGGDVTYHGPGQLVGYPLLPLGTPDLTQKEPGGHLPQADYVGYIRKLEKTLIVALARLGLATGQRPGKSGVWIQADVYSRCPRCRPEDRTKPAKIAAIGVKVDSRGISCHGFALNINPDMTYWEGIIACGLVGEPVASLAELLSPVPTMEQIKQHVATAFCEVFGYPVSPIHSLA